MMPTATLTNATATADVVVAVGMPNRLCNGIPIACIGDMVTGAVVTGTLAVSTAVTRVMAGRPIGNITSQVVGVNPITGIPVTTAIALSPNVTRLI